MATYDEYVAALRALAAIHGSLDAEIKALTDTRDRSLQDLDRASAEAESLARDADQLMLETLQDGRSVLAAIDLESLLPRKCRAQPH